VGIGMGDVTMIDFLDVRGWMPEYEPKAKVYIALASPGMSAAAQALAAMLRAENICVAVDFGEKKLGDQIKAAGKHRIPYLIVIGDDEAKSGTYTVKDLATGEEEKRSKEQLAEFFLNEK
jgi:histidyl-tRNA synthetase